MRRKSSHRRHEEPAASEATYYMTPFRAPYFTNDQSFYDVLKQVIRPAYYEKLPYNCFRNDTSLVQAQPEDLKL